MSSFVQVELALFNDHLLAWEPLIEPIINHRGNVQSPWTISCETIQVIHFLTHEVSLIILFLG